MIERSTGQSESCTTSDNVLAAGLRTIGLADPIWVTRPSVCPSLYPFLSAFFARHRPFIRPHVPATVSESTLLFPLAGEQPQPLPFQRGDPVLRVSLNPFRSPKSQHALQTISFGDISANVRISDFDSLETRDRKISRCQIFQSK